MYLNKVFVVGNLTRDPELKNLPSGQPVANIGVATNRVWKDKDGNKKEQVEYHSVIVFGKQAENCSRYLAKGGVALVEGRLQTRSWEKDGQKQYRTEIIADNITFGPQPKTDSTTSEESVPDDEINPGDIPF